MGNAPTHRTCGLNRIPVCQFPGRSRTAARKQRQKYNGEKP
jgi:hypothetical protein